MAGRQAGSVFTLGWTVDSNGEPIYWLSNGALPGKQADGDVVTVRSEDFAAHTACIAQSGSGKSFFLGRLLEEALCNTSARFVVFDPNGDFLRVGEPAGRSLWESAKYDKDKRKGKLPHESSQEAFAVPWAKVSKRVFSAWHKSEVAADTELFEIWWPSVSAEFIADTDDAALDQEIRHCHAVVRALCELASLRCTLTREETDPLAVAEQFLTLDPGTFNRSQVQEAIESRFSQEHIVTRAQIDAYVAAEADVAVELLLNGGVRVESQQAKNRLRSHLLAGAERRMEAFTRRHLSAALRSLRFVSAPSIQYYFAKVAGYLSNGLVTLNRPGEPAAGVRLAVYELASWDDRSTWLLAASSVLASEWCTSKTRWLEAVQRPPEADDRVPTFVIVDEAHRLIPAEAETRQEVALRNQFRTIAAEGRKYGVFLVIVSQRPDKLDPFVLGECENVALMRLNNASVLDRAKSTLRLDMYQDDLLVRCLEFAVGRALLLGRWAPDGKLLFSAARRTVECGRNLRAETWALSSTQ